MDGSFGADLAAAAADAGVALVAGIFTPSRDGRVYNTAVLFDRTGELVAAYRKLHLFDAFGQQESALVAPGDEVVVAKLAGLSVGLQICYDLRFPELTRTLTSRGADLIVMPAAWGAGLFKEEHWITLARARAIENTVWVAAAGQVPDPDEPPTRAPTGIGRSVLDRPDGHGPARPRPASPGSVWPRSTPVSPLRCAGRSRAWSTDARTSSADRAGLRRARLRAGAQASPDRRCRVAGRPR